MSVVDFIHYYWLFPWGGESDLLLEPAVLFIGLDLGLDVGPLDVIPWIEPSGVALDGLLHFPFDEFVPYGFHLVGGRVGPDVVGEWMLDAVVALDHEPHRFSPFGSGGGPPALWEVTRRAGATKYGLAPAGGTSRGHGLSPVGGWGEVLHLAEMALVVPTGGGQEEAEYQSDAP